MKCSDRLYNDISKHGEQPIMWKTCHSLIKEKIKTEMGKFYAHKFVPVVQEGRVFKSEDDVSVWITDDHNKVPVMIEAKIIVGSVKMELQNYKNLVAPLNKL